MKKITLLAVTVLCCAEIFAVPSDAASKASEMMSAYSSRFYPGVVRYADEILNQDSTSVFAARAAVYKGESLFLMGRVNESLKVLENAAEISKDSSELTSQRLYWIGRGLYSLEKTDSALLYFYKAAEVFKAAGLDSKKNSVYNEAVFYSGKANLKLNRHGDAVKCFEYTVAHGSQYEGHIFEEACVNLMDCCNQDKQFAKAEKLGRKLKDGKFTIEGEYRILLSYGEALEGLGKYSEAYKVYCQVLADGPVVLGASAMQKAYSVSSAHRDQVKEEPGSVLAKASNLIQLQPQLVSEFWTRLAIDAFNSNDFTKALSYFDNAENGATDPLKQLALIYRAEIGFKRSKLVIRDSAKNAYDFIAAGWKKCGFKEGEAYYSWGQTALARYAGMAEMWQKSLEHAENQLNEDSPAQCKKTSAYWAALSLYSQNKIPETVSLLEVNNYTDSDFALLRAKALAKSGRSSEADKIFYDLEQKQKLSNDGVLDYTRTLLNAGHLISTVEQAELATGLEADYMKGLALFNRRKWEEAAKCFAKCTSGTGLEARYVNYSRFYLGYCQYQLSDYSKAYSNLYTFVSIDGVSSLTWDACVTASQSAVQTGKYSEAIVMAGKAMQNSRTEKQKQASVLLTAGIHSDCGQYDQAMSVLRPYINIKDEFGYQCKFMTAQLYVQKKDFEQADKTLSALAQEKAALSIAEEAEFRRGDLKYSNEKYEEAVGLFEGYMQKYPKGQFYVAAEYFAADSLVRTGRKEKAAMYFLEVVEGQQASTYKYGAEKQLVILYKERGEYSKALSMATRMIDEYGEQAGKDGIPLQVKELRALNSGATTEVTRKESEYERSGKEKNAAGRKTGTELAGLYIQNSYTDKAEKLAFTLLAIQEKEESEAMYALSNALLLAGIYRNQGKNKESAEMYLKAAVFARKTGKDDDAGRALYGAAEAFDAAGLSGDLKSTVDSLNQLYPNSRYAKEAVKLVK